MKTILLVVAFIISGLFSVGALLSGNLVGFAFWLLITYVCHRFAFGK